MLYSRAPSGSRAPSVSNQSGVSMHEEEEEELLFLPIAPAQSSVGCMADGMVYCVHI